MLFYVFMLLCVIMLYFQAIIFAEHKNSFDLNIERLEKEPRF